MDGSELYTLCTNLLGGNALDEELFYQLINMQKNMREMSRDWMKLRKIDTSITFTSSDTYLSGKTLPARFLRTYGFYDQYGNLAGPFIVTSSGSKVPLKPLKLAEMYDNRNVEGYYCIDVANGTIVRTGSTAGTLQLPYLQGSADIAEGVAWGLPPSDGYGAILAYDVAVEQKGGIDWDTINASQVPFNQRKINQLEANLATWDARLQQAELGV